METFKHIVVIDPIAYAGGSKVATDNLLATLQQPNLKITIITKDKLSWSQPEYQFIKLVEMPGLAHKEQGIWYFVRHLILALNIIWARLRYGKINIAIGASGPGVDLSLYLTQRLLNFSIIQLIHGPVANSRTIARCLVRAMHVFYLKSTLPSIERCLLNLLDQHQIKPLITSDSFDVLNNGLAASSWPSQCQYHTPKILWAASLLKWKGLDFFIQTMAAIPEQCRPPTEICYIRPQGTDQAISQAPVTLSKVTWHEQPPKFNLIRASCNIFISTSINEPFGLAILEAMAAGHCVVIPSDKAHWDNTLRHGVNCIKYQANDLHDLVSKVTALGDDIKKIKRIGQQGQEVARHYQAPKIYASVKKVVLS